MANQFLPFGLAINANVLTQAAWAADTERMVGFRIGPGLAIKANTAWRQSMFVSAAIAQLVA
ncbi:MAG: hypothetical protein J2P48_16180, partial [Alphaproteobacteria bacterium]|nr:hypothetical protein [Alphaproteobacteria bacterium]